MATRAGTCYGPRLVKERLGKGATRFAVVLTGLLVVAAVPVALAADGPSLRAQADGLRGEAASLDARAQTATLELYALEAQLGRAERELAAVAARRDRVGGERAAVRRQLTVARSAQRISEARLAELVRALYMSSDHDDPLAVVLGATSLEEALTGLDNLDRAAAETTRVVEQARAARARLGKLDRELAAKDAELASLEGAAEARTDTLAAAISARGSFVASLTRQRGLTVARIASIEAAAQAAEQRSVTLAAPAPAPAAATTAPATAAAPTAAPTPVAPVGAGRTLTVEATGYALRGRTASGLPTGPGIVAVDPSVIPLGTRLSIPGYGSGVAADTGGAVKGSIIDLWFPSTAQALAWGRRTVTITVLG